MKIDEVAKMNREIKFRAWGKETEEYFKVLAIDFKSKIVSCRHLKLKYDPFNQINLNYLVLEQFTGLKDSNGNDIYENDLVLLDLDDSPYQVIFDEGKFELSNDFLGLVYDLDEEYMDCKIIGNIHEDKELLEADE